MSITGRYRHRTHARLAALPGVAPVRRPVSGGSADEFDLYYVRSGRKSSHPIVIIPGGPGIASVLPYRGLRRRAAAAGLDLIMIEHRGVGLSRHDDTGADLPPAAMTVDQVVDDVVAVLDDAGVDRAVLYGASYGTYIAAGVGVRYPDRVSAMILDSPLLSTADIETVRAAIRGLLLDGSDPRGAVLAPKVRRLLAQGLFDDQAGQVAAMVYTYMSPALLDRLLDRLLSGRGRLWRLLTRVNRMSESNVAFRSETDLVNRIAFRELDYAGVPDGRPLDPAAAMRQMTDIPVPFESEPYDLMAEMPQFNWPTVVLSGGRDLTTPPAVAERIADLLPEAELVRLPRTGHSVLDTREAAALAVMAAVRADNPDRLSASAPDLDALPRRFGLRVLVAALSLAARAEALLPAGGRPVTS